MPIYLFWGEDDFMMDQAIKGLQQKVLDPAWVSFNFHKIAGEREEGVIEALTQALTPPFGTGGRLVWLTETGFVNHCSEKLLAELQRSLPAIPAHSTLILATSKKPDNRLKATKLLQKHAEIKEFSPLSPWQTEEIFQKVQETAREMGVKLTNPALELLAQSVGNNTRQLAQELEKLKIYADGKTLNDQAVGALVAVNTQNSLLLAGAIRDGQTDRALGLATDLVNRNEHPLAILATLISQFRLWAIVKVMIESGEKDEKAIASAADIPNPKRLFFLRKELHQHSAQKLLKALPLLLDLEVSLKRGASPLATLQTTIMQLCQLFQKS